MVGKFLAGEAELNDKKHWMVKRMGKNKEEKKSLEEGECCEFNCKKKI